MRGLITAAVLASLLWSSPAQACRGPFSETHVFIPALPQDLPDDAIVLRVQRQDDINVTSNGIEVHVVEVVQGDWDLPVAWIEYGAFTSCSRVYLPLDGAFVVGTRSEISSITLNARQYRMSELEGTRDAQ